MKRKKKKVGRSTNAQAATSLTRRRIGRGCGGHFAASMHPIFSNPGSNFHNFHLGIFFFFLVEKTKYFNIHRERERERERGRCLKETDSNVSPKESKDNHTSWHYLQKLIKKFLVEV